MKKRLKKLKDYEIEDESILLKTIKLTKNINYLTEKLPKPNYSPLRYKSLLGNKSSIDHRKNMKNDLDMKISLPPIRNAINRSLPHSERGHKIGLVAKSNIRN